MAEWHDHCCSHRPTLISPRYLSLSYYSSFLLLRMMTLSIMFCSTRHSFLAIKGMPPTEYTVFAQHLAHFAFFLPSTDLVGVLQTQKLPYLSVSPVVSPSTLSLWQLESSESICKLYYISVRVSLDRFGLTLVQAKNKKTIVMHNYLRMKTSRSLLQAQSVVNSFALRRDTTFSSFAHGRLLCTTSQLPFLAQCVPSPSVRHISTLSPLRRVPSAQSLLCSRSATSSINLHLLRKQKNKKTNLSVSPLLFSLCRSECLFNISLSNSVECRWE